MEYILTRKRGMKNIRIRISSDGRILVSAPYYVPKRDIDSFVLEKSSWIEEALSHTIDEDKRNKIGESLVFLGAKRKLIFRTGERGKYHLSEKDIVLFTDKDTDEQEKQRLIYDFFVSEGIKLFPQLLEKYLDKSAYNGKPFSVSLKLLKSKWGSCNLKSRRFTFNLLLLKLPSEYIEYTVAHEVTHLYVKGHGKDFYAMGEGLYKDFFITDRKMNKIKDIRIFD